MISTFPGRILPRQALILYGSIPGLSRERELSLFLTRQIWESPTVMIDQRGTSAFRFYCKLCGSNRGRRRRYTPPTESTLPECFKHQQGELLSTIEPLTLAVDMPTDEQSRYTEAGGTPTDYGFEEPFQPITVDGRTDSSPLPITPKHADTYYDPDDDPCSSPGLVPARVNYTPEDTLPPSNPDSSSSVEEESDCPTSNPTDSVRNFYSTSLSRDSEDEGQIKRWTKPSPGDAVLIAFMDPNRPDIAREVAQRALNSASDEEDRDKDL
jgi:hypothetical protein